MMRALLVAGFSCLALGAPASACPVYACDYELRLVSKFPAPFHPGFTWAQSRFVRVRVEVLAASPSEAGRPHCSFAVGKRIDLIARVGAGIDPAALHGGMRVRLSTRWTPPGGGSTMIRAILE